MLKFKKDQTVYGIREVNINTYGAYTEERNDSYYVCGTLEDAKTRLEELAKLFEECVGSCYRSGACVRIVDDDTVKVLMGRSFEAGEYFILAETRLIIQQYKIAE